MNFKQRYAAAQAAEDLETMEQLAIAAWDTAYERACELDSPNSPGFDELRESIYVELMP